MNDKLTQAKIDLRAVESEIKHILLKYQEEHEIKLTGIDLIWVDSNVAISNTKLVGVKIHAEI